jgi:hypothetical protein
LENVRRAPGFTSTFQSGLDRRKRERERERDRQRQREIDREKEAALNDVSIIEGIP